VEAFESVFSGLMQPDAAAVEVAKRAAQRASVLDAVAGQLGVLRTNLPGEVGQNLDYHLEAVRSLERKLQDDGSSIAGCTPTAPGDTPFDRPEEATTTAQLQMDLMVESLRCGARTVGVLQLGHSGDMFSATMRSEEYALDLGSRHEHVDLAHGWEDQVADRIKLERVYYALFREFIERLAAAPDTEGGSLLDRTVVLWCKSLGYRHAGSNMLFMLAGGQESGITKLGRYLDAGERYQNDLLASCLQLMGQPDTTFGNPEWNQGPLGV
jgi:hypothetical protein